MNRTCILALATVLASALPLAADAASFRQIASTEDGDAYYLDPSTETRVGSYVRMDYFESKTMLGLHLRTRKTLEFDCSGRRSRMIKSESYGADNQVNGSSITFPGFAEEPEGGGLASMLGDPDHALPSSLEAIALDFVCGSTEYRERHPYAGTLP